MRGDFSGHPNRNARGAVKQHDGQARWQHIGLLMAAVVVWNKINRTLVKFVEQQARKRRQACLGVAHRSRIVTIARAKITLPIDQRISQGELLRHAH